MPLNPYIRTAMSFWRNISPTGAVKDFAQVWTDNPYRWRVLAVSIAATTCLMLMIIPKSERITPAKPDVTYISVFEPGRTREQIMASNISNQKKQDALRAIEEQRAELRKSLYRELGRASGLDVDEMEREIDKEEAAQAREEAAKEKAARERAAEYEANRIRNGEGK